MISDPQLWQCTRHTLCVIIGWHCRCLALLAQCTTKWVNTKLIWCSEDRRNHNGSTSSEHLSHSSIYSNIWESPGLNPHKFLLAVAHLILKITSFILYFVPLAMWDYNFPPTGVHPYQICLAWYPLWLYIENRLPSWPMWPPSVWKKVEILLFDKICLDIITWTQASSFTHFLIDVGDGDASAMFSRTIQSPCF